MGRKRDCIATGYSSGDYPIDVQGWINSDFKSKYYGRKPLPLLISIYIDGCLLNSTHTRSAIPVIITILNDKKKSSTVIGFNYEALPIPFSQKLTKYVPLNR